MEAKGSEVKEIRRERVLVPSGMTTREIMEKYGIKPGAAYSAKTRGFL